MLKPQKLPLGLSDFKSLIQEQRYYVDKTLMIQEVWDNSAKVLLLPRPRRFGKTLNLSMLRYFFEHTEISNRSLFEGLAIEAHPEVMEQQGVSPVIFLTFKDVKETSFEATLQKVASLFAREYRRHAKTIQPVLNKDSKLFKAIRSQEASQAHLEESLLFLMEWLHEATGQKVVVLIDEYDAPVHAGYQYEYYDKIIPFIRNLLSAAFKDNNDLEKGVLTGILRIAKESIFSGLNNLGVFSLLRTEFQNSFGFTVPEVQQLLIDFNVQDKEKEVQTWYNGYKFGETIIHNPWSLLNYVDSQDRAFRPYWINTSDNALIQELITQNESPLQKDMETLLEGGSVESELDDNVVLRDIQKNAQTLWSFLVFSGYLKPVAKTRRNHRDYYRLSLPNREVQIFYENTLLHWVQQQIGTQHLSDLLKSLIAEDFKTFGKLLRDSVRESLSFHDSAGKEPERVYHAFVLGLLLNLPHYQIRSNREAGYGRYDVMLLPKDVSQHGMIFEFKKIDEDDDKTPEAALENALKQIHDKEYASELRAIGIQKIWGIGIVIDGKRVWCQAVKIE